MISVQYCKLQPQNVKFCHQNDATGEEAPASKPIVGIIYPPPEVRNIVDKTASFVARSVAPLVSTVQSLLQVVFYLYLTNVFLVASQKWA